ncbi:Crp/Fnr family transcriptional regulator [Fibrobacter sp.]|uniref:Crp/Fnr family transcriptional regulator n=1 Tax=Fibrobacter sp. TaxID=35828 RepID=UPI0025BA3CA1|nr:Crp/Fnr family transcriptional regulator [Fibrobacter sp.]MBR3073334.1 Crp/Fnr family transcriptional regulator [Fibrobacter sp.]
MNNEFKAISISQILPKIPFWANLSSEEKAIVSQRAITKRFNKNQLVSSNSSACLGIILILSGGIRVSLISDEGREVTLYRAHANEFCVSTAFCVIQQLTFDAIVTAEEDTTVLVIPSSVCARLMDSNIHVRAFVFESSTKRYSQTIWAIQQMLFKRFDQRLAAYIIDAYQSTGNPEIKKTQEEIARDVNSAREVVARMLKEFATKGLVEIKRGKIVLKNIEGLKRLV